MRSSLLARSKGEVAPGSVRRRGFAPGPGRSAPDGLGPLPYLRFRALTGSLPLAGDRKRRCSPRRPTRTMWSALGLHARRARSAPLATPAGDRLAGHTPNYFPEPSNQNRVVYRNCSGAAKTSLWPSWVSSFRRAAHLRRFRGRDTCNAAATSRLRRLATGLYPDRMGRRRILPPAFIEPCIPTLAAKPHFGNGWVREIKHDDYRLIVRRNGSAPFQPIATGLYPDRMERRARLSTTTIG
jgi:hypothetical protein